MIKFSEYINLNERFNRQDYSSAFSDPNIMVGLEFEMYLDDLGDNMMGSSQNFDYNSLDREFNSIMDSVKRKVNEYESLKEDYFSEYLVREVWKDDVLPHFKEKIETNEKAIKFEKDKLYKLDIETDYDDYTNIEEYIAELEEEIDDWNVEIDDIRDYITDYDVWELKDALEEHIGALTEDYDWIDNTMSKDIELSSSDLDNFYEHIAMYAGIYNNGNNMEGYGIVDEITEEKYDNFIIGEGGRDVVDDIQEVIFRPSYYDEPDYDEIDMNELEDSHVFDDAPFDESKACYGEYHSCSTNSKEWRVETDSSLSSQGIEVISPAMPISKMVKTTKDMLKFIRNDGWTDKSTGLHMNFSYKGKSFKDANLLKMMLFIDEEGIYKKFGDHRQNYAGTTTIQARRTATTMKHSIKSSKIESTLEKEFKNKKFFQYMTKNMSEVLPSKKFNGINISNAFNEDGSGRVEFRYAGGDYANKEKEVISVMGQYAVALKLAFDPKYKYKEYVLKLNRLYNKTIGKDNEAIRKDQKTTKRLSNLKKIRDKKKK